MIVHCCSDMTETSSSECFYRCLSRCFGFERRRLESNTKTTLESAQNGFSHLDDGNTNGNATMVRVCQPSSHGCYKLRNRNVGETTCCVPQQQTHDELPYEYEPVPTDKDLNGSCLIANDDLSNGIMDNIGTRSDTAVVNGNGHVHATHNGAIDCKLQLSNIEGVKDSNDHTSDLVKFTSSNQRVSSKEKAPEIGYSKDRAVRRGNSCNSLDMKDLFPSSSKESCDFSQSTVDAVAIDSSAEPEGDFKVTKHELVLCNGDLSHAEIISNLQGEENKVEPLQNGQDEGEQDIFYFKSLIEKETIRLNNLIQKWENVLSDQLDIHEEVRDEIRSVNGQTHLVISERFTQFKSLIDQSERQDNDGEQNGTKVITITDLQGFWDMIYFQVQDVISKFERLDKIQSSDWNQQILHENNIKNMPKKNARKTANIRNKINGKTTSTTSEEEKARRTAARRRLAEARKRIAAQEQTQTANFIVQ